MDRNQAEDTIKKAIVSRLQNEEIDVAKAQEIAKESVDLFKSVDEGQDCTEILKQIVKKHAFDEVLQGEFTERIEAVIHEIVIDISDIIRNGNVDGAAELMSEIDKCAGLESDDDYEACLLKTEIHAETIKSVKAEGEDLGEEAMETSA